ncbi:MAG TPA: hypothetical protein VNC50_22150, partial [Planctomycetia bacterium]|nr:hypothetical protein [Planctomycetia bacterium]
RWAIAGALADTPLHDEAWRTLANSVPRNMPFLNFWADYANRFVDNLRRDANIIRLLKERLNVAVDTYGSDTLRRLLTNCDRDRHDAIPGN